MLCMFSMYEPLKLTSHKILAGLVETDPEGALAGFAEVVEMEPEKAEW